MSPYVKPVGRGSHATKPFIILVTTLLLCPWIKQTKTLPPRKMKTLFMNVLLCKAWDERKAGRKRITPNLTIHTPCHFCSSTIFDPSPWPVSIDQTNKWPFPPRKLKHYLWMSPYVKPEMKGRPGGRGSHATQPFTRQTAFKAKETCNLNKFNLVSFKKRLHFFSALCL